jgi:enterochelin esterase family protein
VNRTEEYAGSLQNQFSNFIVNEVVPWIDTKYRTIPIAEKRAVMGASNGGNISLWLALNYSSVFGNVAAQSSNVQSTISTGFQNASLLNLKFYLDIGSYDIPILIQLVNNFIPILQSKGYPYQYQVYHEGHSWGNWRAHIDNALIMFFPGSASLLRTSLNSPQGFLLSQNYPNPFNPRTVISYQLAVGGFTKLTVFDLLGRKVVILVNGQQAAGSYEIQFDGSNIASGIYMYRLETEHGFVQHKKMVLMK